MTTSDMSPVSRGQTAVRVRVIGDEISPLADEQFSYLTEHGYTQFVGRFFQFAPEGPRRNFNALEPGEVRALKKRADDAGVGMTCNATPLLKMGVSPDVNLGQPFQPLSAYRETVRQVAERSGIMNCPMNRVFSLYPPRGEDPTEYVSLAVDYLGATIEEFGAYGQKAGLEIEANLVGRNSTMISAILRQLGRPDAIGVLWDPANVVVLPKSRVEVMATYAVLAAEMVGVHIKDCRKPDCDRWPDDHVPEDKLDGFCLPGRGDGCIPELVEELRRNFERRMARAAQIGVEFCLDMEPHLASGGQYGGTSGPANVTRAVSALVELLEAAGIPSVK